MTEFEKYLDELYKEKPKDEDPKGGAEKGSAEGEKKDVIEGNLPYSNQFKEFCEKQSKQP